MFLGFIVFLHVCKHDTLDAFCIVGAYIYVFCLCNSFEYHKITEKAHFDAPYYSSLDFTSTYFLKYMLHIQKQGFVPFLLQDTYTNVSEEWRDI